MNNKITGEYTMNKLIPLLAIAALLTGCVQSETDCIQVAKAFADKHSDSFPDDTPQYSHEQRLGYSLKNSRFNAIYPESYNGRYAVGYKICINEMARSQ